MEAGESPLCAGKGEAAAPLQDEIRQGPGDRALSFCPMVARPWGFFCAEFRLRNYHGNRL